MTQTIQIAKTAFFYDAADAVDISQALNHTRAFLTEAGGRKPEIHMKSDGSVMLSAAPVHATLRCVAKDSLCTAMAQHWDAECNNFECDVAQSIMITVEVDEMGPEGIATPILAGIGRAVAALRTPVAVQWLKSNGWVEGAAFAQVLTRVEPKRAACPTENRRARPTSRAAALSEIRLTEHAIRVNTDLRCDTAGHLRLRSRNARRSLCDFSIDAELESDVTANTAEKFAAWSLTASVAVFSLPLAGVIVAANVAKGPNVRVAAQFSALVGFITVLGSTGAIAQVATVLGV